MLETRILQKRQGQRYANAVVGTERRSFCKQPTVTQHGANRIARKVMYCLRVFLANHVQMRLQNHSGNRFAPRACRFTDNQITDFIDLNGQAASFRPGLQMLAQARFAFGRTWDGTQAGKMRPDNGGL